jgi:hypothetical protein
MVSPLISGFPASSPWANWCGKSVSRRMKRTGASKPVDSKRDVIVSSGHPLVGTWIEEENPILTTSVVYTITATEGRFCVSGVDESDGVVFNISNTRWDGERLYFVSLFPTTNHEASHVFQIAGRGRARHTVSYSDEYGDHTVHEVWKKRHQS